MAITRDADYPPEMAALMEAFNRCADGHEANVVLNTSMQMVIAAINYNARARGYDRYDTLQFCQNVCELISKGVADNFQRKSQETDVPVAAQ